MPVNWTALSGHLNQGGGVQDTYSPANVALIPGGGVKLHAYWVPPDPLTWYSAFVMSNDTLFRFGYFEARARLCRCLGLDSAFFLFRYATQEEVDFELWDPAAIKINVACHDYHNQHYYPFEYPGNGVDLSADFHLYGFEWTYKYVRFFIDRVAISEMNTSDLIPQQAMKVYFGLSVGAAAGSPDNTCPVSVDLLVDYVKIWQR